MRRLYLDGLKKTLSSLRALRNSYADKRSQLQFKLSTSCANEIEEIAEVCRYLSGLEAQVEAEIKKEKSA